MLCAQHWDKYFAYPQSKMGGDSQNFPNQMTDEVLPCDKSVIGYVCCLGFWDGWHFIAGRGREKVLRIPPTPPKKCAEKLLRVRAVERQTCIKTTRRHAATQVCSLQLLSGRQMSAVLHLIWITLAQSGNFFPLFGTHSLDDSLLGHRARYWLTKTGWFENGDVSCQFCKLTNVNQTKLSIQPKLGSETQF